MRQQLISCCEKLHDGLEKTAPFYAVLSGPKGSGKSLVRCGAEPHEDISGGHLQNNSTICSLDILLPFRCCDMLLS